MAESERTRINYGVELCASRSLESRFSNKLNGRQESVSELENYQHSRAIYGNYDR